MSSVIPIRLVAIAACVLAAACSARPASDGEPGAAEATSAMFTGSDAYERFMGRWSRLLAPSLLTFAELQDGESVLDVGSGTGAVADAIVAVTTSATVVGIDPSSAYVEAATARRRSDRATFEVGDGQQMRFAADSFDRTLSLLVMNFIPDPGKALDEMIRVTRPGGTVAAAVWDYGEGMQMLRVFWDEAVAQNPAAEARDEKHMPLCKPGELEALWRAHGLTGVTEAPLVIETTFESFDDFWLPFLDGQGPAGAYVASLPADQRDELARHLRERLQPDASGAIRLRARAWAVKGTVPIR